MDVPDQTRKVNLPFFHLLFRSDGTGWDAHLPSSASPHHVGGITFFTQCIIQMLISSGSTFTTYTTYTGHPLAQSAWQRKVTIVLFLVTALSLLSLSWAPLSGICLNLRFLSVTSKKIKITLCDLAMTVHPGVRSLLSLAANPSVLHFCFGPWAWLLLLVTSSRKLTFFILPCWEESNLTITTLPRTTSSFLLPSGSKNLSLCTAPQSSFLSARLDAAQFKWIFAQINSLKAYKF